MKKEIEKKLIAFKEKMKTDVEAKAIGLKSKGFKNGFD